MSYVGLYRLPIEVSKPAQNKGHAAHTVYHVLAAL